MDWVQFIILILAVGGLFWSQKSDINLNRAEAATDRRDMLKLLHEIRHDTEEFKKTWAAESKDFHGRLCKIEEARGK